MSVRAGSARQDEEATSLLLRVWSRDAAGAAAAAARRLCVTAPCDSAPGRERDSEPAQNTLEAAKIKMQAESEPASTLLRCHSDRAHAAHECAALLSYRGSRGAS